MIPPTSIDGTDITGANIDGTDVTEITVDGDVVFTSGFSYFDDFDTDTRSDYNYFLDGTSEPSSSASISNSAISLPFANDNACILEYVFDSTLSGSFELEIEVKTYPDDDGMVIGVVDGVSPYYGSLQQQFTFDFTVDTQFFSDIDNTSQNYPTNGRLGARPNDSGNGVASVYSFSAPFTLKLVYDDSANTLALEADGVERVSISATINQYDKFFIIDDANDPASSFDSVSFQER